MSLLNSLDYKFLYQNVKQYNFYVTSTNFILIKFLLKCIYNKFDWMHFSAHWVHIKAIIHNLM